MEMENGYCDLTLNKIHRMICRFLNANVRSVRADDLKTFLKDNLKPFCPFCAHDIEFKFYTDGRTGFHCKNCRAVGNDYVGDG